MSYIRCHRAAVSAHPPISPVLRLADRLPVRPDPRTIAAMIASHRAEAASLEADWAAESERAAARSLGGVGRLGDRATWDRATWDRYLNASTQCQQRFQPRLKWLYAEIARLEGMEQPATAQRRRAA